MEELQKLDDNTFIQMLAEIYGWRHVNGKLLEGGRVVKFKEKQKIPAYKAEEMILEEADNRYHQLIKMIICNAPDKYFK